MSYIASSLMLTNEPLRLGRRRVLAAPRLSGAVAVVTTVYFLNFDEHVGVEARQAVAAERGQHDRLVRRDLQQLADLFARPRGVPRDERDVLDVREALEPARHRQPQRHRRLGVGAANRRQQRRREAHARIVGVDPVPREVAEPDRRDARRCADREGERRDVADDQPGAELAQRRASRWPRASPGRCGTTAARRMLSASSSVSASTCTTPVSHSSVL